MNSRRQKKMIISLFSVAVFLFLACFIPAMQSGSRAAAADGSPSASILTGDFFGGMIRNESDALDAVYSVIRQIGGSAKTALRPVVITPTQNGVTYYSFQQIEAGEPVYGSTVKLVTDSAGKAVVLVSSIGDASANKQDRLRPPYAAAIHKPASLEYCVSCAWNLNDRSLPMLKDPRNGRLYLADQERNILCADYRTFMQEHRISPCSIREDCIDEELLLTYENFIRVYDLFRFMGWQGPDGQDSPVLLLMDLTDEQGEPMKNAFYMGQMGGHQTFAFGRGFGSCIDVIGHEFMHCVTQTVSACSIHQDEYGAVNEGLSDIMGNLVEMILEGESDGSWLIGENSGSVIRSLRDPHRYGQPAALWDPNYVPAGAGAGALSDNGGIHTNSSLLSRISYQLYTAGMDAGQQCYFWMNTVLAMTPYTDFAQLGQLLPCCMNLCGYPEYTDDLVRAMKETGLYGAAR